MTDDHQQIERACVDLLCETLGDDPRALITAWRGFEAELRSHLAVEETVLLDDYERDAPDDARAIRAAHGRVRGLLDALGVEVELHVIRAATVRALIAELRDHAAHEEAGLYRWAAATGPHAPPQGPHGPHVSPLLRGAGSR